MTNQNPFLDFIENILLSTDYENLKEKLWGITGLSCNPSITSEFIEKHLNQSWYWGKNGLSSNPAITTEFIEKHINRNWWWGSNGLSSNPSITTDFIEKHINRGWWWENNGLSSNPSITVDFVKTHFDKIVLENIVSNPFTFEIKKWQNKYNNINNNMHSINYNNIEDYNYINV
jgi:hypothetical protein